MRIATDNGLVVLDKTNEWGPGHYSVVLGDAVVVIAGGRASICNRAGSFSGELVTYDGVAVGIRRPDGHTMGMHGDCYIVCPVCDAEEAEYEASQREPRQEPNFDDEHKE